MYKIRKELQPALRLTNPRSREELDAMLAGLDAVVPQLIAHNPDGADFMPLFADKVDAIARQADVTDHRWLMGRVDALLAKHGKHHDEYLPPHDLLHS